MGDPNKVPLIVEDMTGTDRIARNVASGWLAQLVVLVSGFIVPRLIDEFAGRVSLGIWDLSWSTVRYLALANFGVASAMGRYVAFYRASDDQEKLERTVSTVLVWQSLVTILVLAAAGALVMNLDKVLTDLLVSELETIRWVVGMLALSLAAQMFFGSARGLLTGYHRWDINNAANAFSDSLSAVAIVLALVLGGGMKELATAYLVAIVVAELFRAYKAIRLLPSSHSLYRGISWELATEFFVFGAKTTIVILPGLLIVQTSNIILASVAGAATLAIFARPLSLVNNINTAVAKFAMLLAPMAGSYLGLGRSAELKELLVDSARTSLLISGPLLAILAVDGNVILRIWMGADYAASNVPLILAIGAILPITLNAAANILAGLNAHGRMAVISLMVSMTTYGAVWLMIYDEPITPEHIAILVAISTTTGQGLSILIYSCRLLSVPVSDFIQRALISPGIHVALFAVLLWLPVKIWGETVLALIAGVLLGSLVITRAYWKMLFSKEWKQRIIANLPPVLASRLSSY